MGRVVTFRGTRLKAGFAIFVAVCFVVTGVVISRKNAVLGWTFAAFWALCVPLGVIGLLPNATYLRLDEEGFEVGSLRGGRRTKWTDVAGFRIDSVNGARMIAVIYSSEYKQLQVTRRVVESLTGMQGAIGNLYNAPLEEILAALDSWRDHFSTERI
jgi:hypothetical protein